MNLIRRDIVCHNRACRNDGPATDPHTRDQNGTAAYPYIPFEHGGIEHWSTGKDDGDSGLVMNMIRPDDRDARADH